MTAITIGPSRSYIRNVHAAVHDLIVALLALDRGRPAATGRRRQREGGALYQAYADVLAWQALPKDAAQPRSPVTGLSHAMLPYHLWSARACQD